MSKLKELQERRLELAGQIRSIAGKFDEKTGQWDGGAEVETSWRAVNEDYNKVTAEIDREKRSAEVAGRLADLDREDRSLGGGSTGGDRRGGHDTGDDGQPTAKDRKLAFRSWLRGSPRNEAEWDAVRRTRTNLSANFIDFDPVPGEQIEPSWARRGAVATEQRAAGIQARAAQTVTTTGGGYAISTGFLNRFEIALLKYGGIRRNATVLRTEQGNPIEFPTVDDTANKGRWLSINTAATNTAVAIGQKTLSAWLASSDYLLLPIQLIEDAAIDVEMYFANMLGERMGRLTASAYAVGDNSGMPNGIVTASTLGKTTASATAVTGDELLEFVHSVDPAYRESDGCGWAFHDNVLLAVRKLKDGNSNYLFQPGLTVGEPDRLLGYPYTVCNDMDSTINTGSKIAVFGDLSKYMIRDIGQVRIVRLIERFAEAHQIGLLGFMRTDGELIDAGTNPVKHLLTA